MFLCNSNKKQQNLNNIGDTNWEDLAKLQKTNLSFSLNN